MIDPSNSASIGSVSIERNKTGQEAVLDISGVARENSNKCTFVGLSLSDNSDN